MPRLLRFFLPLLLVAAASLRAQSARWEPASGTLARDQISQLTLVFQDAEPKDTPAPPAADGLVFVGSPGRSEQSSFNLTLGSRAVRQRTINYVFAVRPTRADGEVRIPAFTVETDAGPLTVPPAGFTLAAASVGGRPLEDIVRARFTPPAAPIWAGEVFRLVFTLDLDRRYLTNSILQGPPEWSPAPLVAEDWSKPVGSESTAGGQPRFLVTMETRAIAPASTSATLLPIPSATQVVNLPTGTANPFSLFGQSTFEQKTVATAPARLAINPLPSPAPADFIGAVGSFTLVSKVVPEKAAVGEPVTWTLTLEGTGNWPSIDKLRPRSLSRDFRVVTPRAQKTNKPDSLFDAALSEDLVLIPQKAGRTTLGPYTVSIFNPSTGAYETLRTEPVQIEITPAAAPLAAAPASPAASSTVANDVNPPPAAPVAPAPVAKLPSDPLPPGLLAGAPRPAWPRALLWTPLALLIPALLWLVFAARHARTHDPLRARRAAHDELRRILARLENNRSPGAPAPASSPLAADLLAWQHATRALFALVSQTPSARDLPDPAWAALWIETERALYRPATPLAPEWFAAAWEAHARATPPRRSPLAALRFAHLFPRVALPAVLALVACGLFAPASIAAEPPATPPDALQLYARGDFPAAESALRATLATAPLDAAVRHNLALALAQQGRWDEAAAHAYAAALQRPDDPALRRLLDALAPKAAYRIQPPPTAARLLAAPGWQTLALASAFVLLALVPAFYLCAAYLPAPRGRPPRILGHVFLVGAGVSLAAALLALRAHGPAADPSAALVWRAAKLRAVPTDAGEQKVVADLPAGTLARIDKDFLGWRRLVLPDGNTGWVRAEPLIPLWR